MRVLYLALAGGSIDHDQHKISQINTWADNSQSAHRVIWMHGNPSLKEPQLLGNDLFLPIEEKYENLLEKTILAVRWALENLEFDYLIRTNTSNYFYSPLVENYLAQLASKQAGGVIASWRGMIKETTKSHEYISGAGIFLSRFSTGVLSKIDFAQYEQIPDDVAIGHWLSQNGIEFRSFPRNNITDFKPLWPTVQTRVKSWIHPEITISRMYEIHEIYSTLDSELIKQFENNEVNRARNEKKKRAYLLRFHYAALNLLIIKKFNSLRK